MSVVEVPVVLGLVCLFIPLQEGVAMASMDHPYVVRLFGISMGRKMMLVSQFVPLGSLLDFLRKHKERLNAKNMLTFSHQIAEVCASGHQEPSPFKCSSSMGMSAVLSPPPSRVWVTWNRTAWFIAT